MDKVCKALAPCHSELGATSRWRSNIVRRFVEEASDPEIHLGTGWR